MFDGRNGGETVDNVLWSSGGGGEKLSGLSVSILSILSRE